MPVIGSRQVSAEVLTVLAQYPIVTTPHNEEGGIMKRLSNKIMEIDPYVDDEHMYLIGHNDAKHAAAGMAIVYDDVMIDLKNALEAAIECGMVPVSSAKDGGASRHSRQVHVADQMREALAKARYLDEHQNTEGVE